MNMVVSEHIAVTVPRGYGNISRATRKTGNQWKTSVTPAVASRLERRLLQSWPFKNLSETGQAAHSGCPCVHLSGSVGSV